MLRNPLYAGVTKVVDLGFVQVGVCEKHMLTPVGVFLKIGSTIIEERKIRQFCGNALRAMKWQGGRVAESSDGDGNALFRARFWWGHERVRAAFN